MTLYTDSEYLKRGITEWLPGWRKRGWRRKGGALANLELWQALDEALQPHQVEWRWVRGHAGERPQRARRPPRPPGDQIKGRLTTARGTRVLGSRRLGDRDDVI